RQPSLVLKFAAWALRFPRRHQAFARDHIDLGRAPLRIAVRKEAERTDLAGAMTRRTAIPENRCDVLREGGAWLCGRGRGHQQRPRDNAPPRWAPRTRRLNPILVQVFSSVSTVPSEIGRAH